MILVYRESGTAVKIGDVVTTGAGHTEVVSQIIRPHKPSSTGRVELVRSGELDGDGRIKDTGHGMLYFPGVINAHWVEGKLMRAALFPIDYEWLDSPGVHSLNIGVVLNPDEIGEDYTQSLTDQQVVYWVDDIKGALSIEEGQILIPGFRVMRIIKEYTEVEEVI